MHYRVCKPAVSPNVWRFPDRLGVYSGIWRLLPPHSGAAMRVVEDTQFKLGQVPIDQMEFFPKDRDDIPAVLYGLKHLYCDTTARKKIFEILEKRLLPGINLQRGRPGMSLWRIFVLGVLQKIS